MTTPLIPCPFCAEDGFDHVGLKTHLLTCCQAWPQADAAAGWAAYRRASHPALAPVERWTPAKKAAVVLALHYGEITVADAIAAHVGLTAEEIGCWQRVHRRFGQDGLAVGLIREVRA